MTCSRSIHISTNDPVSFILWQSNIPFIYIHTHHIFFIHSSVDGYLGCFHVLAVLNSAAMNIGMHVPFWIMVLSGYMPNNGIAGSYAYSPVLFQAGLWTITLAFPPLGFSSCFLVPLPTCSTFPYPSILKHPNRFQLPDSSLMSTSPWSFSQFPK